jgi:hypothetical protein
VSTPASGMETAGALRVDGLGFGAQLVQGDTGVVVVVRGDIDVAARGPL